MNIVTELDSIIKQINQIKLGLKFTKNFNGILPKIPESIPNEERIIIQAMLQGYLTDKEILNYLDCLNCKIQFSLRYQMFRLFDKYDCVSRGQLLRKLIKEFC